MSKFVLTAQLQLQAPNNVKQVVQQIQQQLQGVTVNVQVQGAVQAQKQIQQVAQASNQATTAAERMGKAFALSIRRFAAFSIATRAVSLFTSTLGSAVETAIDFERQLIKVSQVTGKSISQLRGLTKQITNLSTGFGVASSDLLEVSTVLAQAGLTAEDTSIALRTLAKAALAPNFDSITETAEGAIAILAQFGQGVGALEKQLGSINAVAGAFAVEASDLIDVVRRTGGVFKASGGDLNELLALFTSVRATTRESAESIGTGLRTIFTRIQRPKTIEFLKQFGVELVDLNGKFVGPYEAIRRLSEALSGLGEGDLTFISIAEELGGFRQIGKVLPLLQQFSTAQSALNVAMKAGDSLTQDAASAQAALAIRIMKVREEFLALIRSVTETSTFQIMANSALSLASALIKIADSIKPLLPMLAALAAFKVAKGLGGFFGGIMSGATSGRTYNKGGKVLGFARGGLVPGTGNSDTVPAMLAPGEFVIRKSSVNKMGAGTLAAMNNNRYAMGGTVGAIALNPMDSQATGKGTVTVKDILATLSNNNQLAGGISGNLKLTDKSGKLQNLMDRKEAPDGLTFGNRLEKLVSRIAFGGKNRQTFTTKGVSFPSTKNSDSSVEQGIKTSLTNAYTGIIPNVASQLASSVGLPTAIGAFNQNVIKSIGLEDATGKIFEAAVSSLGAPFDANRGKQDRDAFDFPMGIGSHLGQFKAFSELADKPTDAKKTLDSSILNDIASRKTMNTLAEQVNTSGTFQALKKRVLSMEGTSKGRSEFDNPKGPRKKFFGGLIQKFAKGGGVARDPKNTLQSFFEGNSLYSSDRKETADKIRDMRSLRSAAPKLLYSSISRNAFDSMANQTGLNKNPKIPEGTRLFDREKYYDQEAKKIIGRTFKLSGFLSTSKEMNKAKMFLDNADRSEDKWAAMMTIMTKKNAMGVDVEKQLSGRKVGGSKQALNPRTGKMETFYQKPPESESEFTLQPGSRFKINSSKLVDMMGRKNLWMDVQQFAKGGGVGTDTVPALLTPGEFVINRSSAQNIGYGNLNRMNKVGRYASGGIVQKFASGTPMAGAQPASSKSNPGIVAFVGLDSLTQQAEALTKAQIAQTKAVDSNAESQNKSSGFVQNFGQSLYFSLGGLTAVQAALTSLTPVIDENSSAFERVGATLLNTFSNLASTIGISIIALQQMNIQLSLATAKMVAQNALDFLSGAKSLTDLFSTIKGGIPGLKSFSTIFKRGMAGRVDAPGGAGLSRGIGLAGRATQATIDTGKSLITRGATAATAINKSNIGRGFSAGLNSPNATFSNIFGSSKGIATKASGALGRTLSVGGDALSKIPGVGAVKSGLSTAGGTITKAGSQFYKGASATIANPAKSVIGSGASVSAQAGGLAGKGLTNLNKLSGPAIGLGLAFTAITSVIDSFVDYQGQANKAIQDGNVEKAKSNAIEAAGSEAINGLGSTIIGISSLFGPFGLAVGVATASALKLGSELPIIGPYIKEAAIGIGTLFGGNTADSIRSLAAAQAQGVKTQKALNDGSEAVTKAMKDLENGTITASQAIASNAMAGQEVMKNSETSKKAIADNEKNKSGMVGGFLRGTARVGTLGLAGYMGLESGKQRNTRIDKENKELSAGDKKAQEALIQQSTPAINALSRQFAVAGGSFEDVMEDIKKNNPGLYFSLVNQGSTQLKQGFDNIAKEVAKAKKAFEALNLGLRGPVATANAAAASLSVFADSLEVGSTPITQGVATLEAAFSEAGQAMNPKNVQSAINDVAANLEQLGATDKSVQMFKENAAAFAAVSANYNEIFEGVKKDFSKADFRGLNAEGFTDKFAKNLDEQLKNAGIGEDVRKRMQDVLGNVKLSNDDMTKLRGGDLSVFQKYLDEAGQKTLEEAKKVAEQTAKINQQLISLTKQRIEAERNLVQAQQEALDLTMEGREVEAKYGGRAVTNQERKGNLLAKSNVEGSRLGLTAMKSGDIGELRRRNAEIGGAFGNIESRKSQRNGMQGVAGVEADETQKDLQKAYRTQIETIRGLIKLEEDQLKITQEKNKLEKDSLESLVKGDVEEFFKKQSAVGATAAIASGDERLMKLYGSQALGAASMDIQRQQEAGVQTLYGQQLAGPGGLSEAAAGAALSSMGVRDARAAQVLSGTTPEEEASKSRLRQLGGMLGETGQLGTEMAEMQVQTETVIVNAAKLELADVVNRGREAGNAVGMAKGGLLYASNGIFVPRGTDTIPAMLTPGEFVVNRNAVQRGNNLRVLQAMNNGSSGVSNNGTAMMADGGMVRYRRFGSKNAESPSPSPSSSSDSMSIFTAALNTFNRDLTKNIEALKSTEIKIKLDATNVNINLTGMQALASVSQSVKNEILTEIMNKINTLRATTDGELKSNPGIVPRMA
jgi:TP901 family phage tail tape measure protein